MHRTVGNPAAKAAIDMAVWDALGRCLDLPVTELLGGFTDHLRVSHMIGFAPPEKMVAEAEQVRSDYGITTFKVKVGRRPVSRRQASRRQASPRPAGRPARTLPAQLPAMSTTIRPRVPPCKISPASRGTSSNE